MGVPQDDKQAAQCVTRAAEQGDAEGKGVNRRTTPVTIISINLSPHMRGKGLAKKCLSSAIDYFKTSFAKVSFIDAEIKSQNIASKAVFAGVGFVLEKESDNVLYYTYSV